MFNLSREAIDNSMATVTLLRLITIESTFIYCYVYILLQLKSNFSESYL